MDKSMPKVKMLTVEEYNDACSEAIVRLAEEDARSGKSPVASMVGALGACQFINFLREVLFSDQEEFKEVENE